MLDSGIQTSQEQSTTPNRRQQSQNWSIHHFVTIISMKSIIGLFYVLNGVSSVCLNSLEIANISSTRAALTLNRKSNEQCDNLKINWKLLRMKACQTLNYQEKYSSNFYHLRDFQKLIFIENLQPFSVYKFRYQTYSFHSNKSINIQFIIEYIHIKKICIICI